MWFSFTWKTKRMRHKKIWNKTKQPIQVNSNSSASPIELRFEWSNKKGVREWQSVNAAAVLFPIDSASIEREEWRGKRSGKKKARVSRISVGTALGSALGPYRCSTRIYSPFGYGFYSISELIHLDTHIQNTHARSDAHKYSIYISWIFTSNLQRHTSRLCWRVEYHEVAFL